ncbi:hypothetical protein B0H10DRAFT_2393213, partial [Mycena sp. CBHHK59/15]
MDEAKDHSGCGHTNDIPLEVEANHRLVSQQYSVDYSYLSGMFVPSCRFIPLPPGTNATSVWERVRSQAQEELDRTWSSLQPHEGFNPIRDIISRVLINDSTSPRARAPSPFTVAQAFESEKEVDDRISNLFASHIQTLFAAPKSLDQSPYNNTVSLVQSSGMGKSWLLDRVSKTLFTLPINIRDPVEDGYPPADRVLHSYFLDINKQFGAHQRMAKLAAFLEALFEETAKSVQKNNLKEPASWRNWLKSEQSIDVVGPTANHSILRFGTERHWYVFSGKLAISQPSTLSYKDTHSDTMDVVSNPIDANMTDVSRANIYALLTAFTRLQAQLATTEPILMYIDEAHELTWRSPTHETDTLANLSEVLALIVELPFSVVFLSTSSWLAALAPRPSDFPSRRNWSKTHLHAPWTELPFDCRASGAFKAINMMTGQAASLQQLCSLDHITRFGRPLWRGLYEKLAPANQAQFLAYVARKFTSNQDEEESKVAALGLRIILDFDIARESARRMEASLVRSYLRVAYVVPESREYMRTGAPSEPLLVEAVAEMYDHNLQIMAPEILAAFFQRGLLAKGERGELVARLLWILARDAAVNRLPVLPPTDPNRTAHFHRPILVLDWLKALLHPDHHAAVLEARPIGDPKGLILEDAFKDVWINFTHFARAGDYEVIKTPRLWQCL